VTTWLRYVPHRLVAEFSARGWRLADGGRMTKALEIVVVVIAATTLAAGLIVLRWWLGWPDELIDAFLKGLRGE
jgi:methionyl-tRNA synthetase